MISFNNIMKDVLGIDLSVYAQYKIESAAGLVLCQGTLPNKAVVVHRYFTKANGLLEVYDSHKRFSIEVRNIYICNLSKAGIRVATIAQMMQISAALVHKVLKENQHE